MFHFVIVIEGTNKHVPLAKVECMLGKDAQHYLLMGYCETHKSLMYSEYGHQEHKYLPIIKFK